MKAKNKTMSKKHKIILIILAILIFIFSSIAGYFICRPYFSDDNSFGEIMSRVDKIIEYNWNLSETQKIFNSCSIEKNESAQILCVNKWAVNNYNYAPRDKVYSIDEMFEKGADCKSYSVYYATLAKMMGYDYAFFNTHNHVMTLVYFDKGYCILDQDFGMCVYYNEEQI